MGLNRIIFGADHLERFSAKEAGFLLSSALDSGISTIDTARVYGSSESLIGDWLKDSKVSRDRLKLITKGGHPDGVCPRISRVGCNKSLSD